MADEKKKFVPAPKHLTPVGKARFPHLITPDDYQGQLKYKCGLILPSAEAAKVIAIITAEMPKAVALKDAFLAATKAKGKKAKDQEEMFAYSDILDPETGEETGDVLVNFAAGADMPVFVKGQKTDQVKRRVIPFFDAKGQPVVTSARPNLWGGSRIRISFSCFPYHNAGANNYGVSLRLEAVKVIEAVTGGGGAGAEAYGMGEEEEGWSKPAPGSMESDESGDTEMGGSTQAPPSDEDF